MSHPTRSWAVVRQDLTKGKPIDPPYPVGWAGSAHKARGVRAKYATEWVMEPPGDRSFRGRRGSIDLCVHHGEGIGTEVVARLTVEDKRPRVDRGRARYAVEVQGEVVGWHRTKTEAATALYQEVEKWRSSRWPARRAIPSRRREEWTRQILHYYLKDRGTYAGEIRLLNLRRR